MEMGDTYSSKLSRSRNSAVIPAQEQPKDEEEDDRSSKSVAAVSRGLLQPWQQHSTASRIYRVARASGGKDRHSKVMTAKGLRDRRVRLSVSTAIQFYDLQDRLGYDQPSKAIEWLIKAAAAAISELPSLDGVFFDQPLPLRHLKPDDEKPVPEQDDDDDVSEMQFSGHHHQHHQHFSLARSTCSSTSETSRSSVLSLSRSEIHAKAKDKDKETEADDHHHSLDPCAGTPQSSFTELLTGHLPTADYHFRKQLQPAVFGNTSQLGDHFMGQLVPYGVTTSGGDLINFSISAGISGLNRGTLQSNSPSPSLHQHLERFSSPGDGSNLPLFLGGAAAHPSAGPEGQLPAGFDSRIHLCYQGFRNADLKGKEKS